MDKDIAISVKNVSKTFKIPHEKISSLRGAVTGAFKKGGFEEFKALDDVSFEVKKGRILWDYWSQWQRQIDIAENFGWDLSTR